MYCSQCGKRIKDTMRFCPFCGAQVELPEQDGPQAQQGFSENLRRDDSGVFIPLSMDESVWNVPDAKPEPRQKGAAEPDKRPELQKKLPQPAMKQPMGQAESRAQAEAKANAAVDELDLPPRKTTAFREQPTQTYTVQRRFDPGNIFFDEQDDDDDDDDYVYTDERDRGFISRHMGAFIALLVVLALLVAGACFLYSGEGQRLLAKFGFAWRAQPIASVAHEDYLAGRFQQAAEGYAKALEIDPDGYDYARNASITYYQAGDMKNAADMARRAIAIDPVGRDPYDMLRMIYPDEGEMPEDVKALLEE